jgi:hypothetical protein
MDITNLQGLMEAYQQVNAQKEEVEIEEGKKEFPHKKVDRQVYDAMDSGETAGDSGNSDKEKRDYSRAERMRSVAAKHGGKSRMKEEVEEILEAEGSYGQTPKARAAMGKLAVSRMNKPASEYSQRGEKTRKLKAAERHTRRQDRLASGNNRHGSRGPMDQARRDWSRGADDYGHSGYDGDGYGGSVTKNPKKLRKQKAMGEID